MKAEPENNDGKAPAQDPGSCTVPSWRLSREGCTAHGGISNVHHGTFPRPVHLADILHIDPSPLRLPPCFMWL